MAIALDENALQTKKAFSINFVILEMVENEKHCNTKSTTYHNQSNPFPLQHL
jgi:hypothetical protein